MSKWTTRNRASVIHSSIQVTVLIKEQLEAAIKWCVDNNYDFTWEVNRGDSLTPDEYVLSIEDMSWANNLTEFAKILERSDYESDVMPREDAWRHMNLKLLLWYGDWRELNMAGTAIIAMVIDFSKADGTIVIAKAPAFMTQEQANAAAEVVYDKVEAAEQADYALYADGKFNMRDAIERELAAIGAEVVVVQEERYWIDGLQMTQNILKLVAEVNALQQYRSMMFQRWGKFMNNSLHDFSQQSCYADMVKEERQRLETILQAERIWIALDC
jgi:hypothetical protein